MSGSSSHRNELSTVRESQERLRQETQSGSGSNQPSALILTEGADLLSSMLGDTGSAKTKRSIPGQTAGLAGGEGSREDELDADLQFLAFSPTSNTSGVDPNQSAILSSSGSIEMARKEFLAYGSAADIWLIICTPDQNVSTMHVLKSMRVNCLSLEDIDGNEDIEMVTGQGVWETIINNFRSKLEIWSYINHQNVVSVFRSPSPLSLEVEYCPSGCVRDFLKDNPTSDQTKRKMIIGVTEGLRYLHEHDPPIVHGSLNAGKIFLDQNLNVKIGEFGLAALVEPFSGIIPAIVYPGLRWTSPELVKLDPAVSALTPTRESDIWALGCTLLEITAEHLPYMRYRHEVRLRRAITSGEPPGQIVQQSCSEGIRIVINMCWSQVPEHRPQMYELAQVLDTRT